MEFRINAHYGCVRTRRGIQSMQTFYVGDAYVGTRVSDVAGYIKMKAKTVPTQLIRTACRNAKDDHQFFAQIISGNDSKGWNLTRETP